MKDSNSKRFTLLLLISLLFLMSILLPLKTNYPPTDPLMNTTSRIKALSTQTGSITNESYNWYKITFNEGEEIRVNVSCVIETNFIIGAVITDQVQPYDKIGYTKVLVGGVINATQNATLSYRTWDFFQKTFGVFLLIISLNDSNPAIMNYTIDCSHALIPYSYYQWYNEVYLVIVLIVAVIVIGIAAVISMYIIVKWRGH